MIDYLELANSSRSLQSYIGNGARYLANSMYVYQDTDQARKENARIDRLLANSVCFYVGNYDDEAVHESNLDVIKDIFEEEIAQDRVVLSYAISYKTTVIVHKSLLEKLSADILEPLSRYPSLDDDHLSDVTSRRFEDDTNDEIDSFWRREVEEEYISQERFKAECWQQITVNHRSLENDYGEINVNTAMQRAYRKLRLLPVVADKMFNHYAKHLTAMLPVKVTR